MRELERTLYRALATGTGRALRGDDLRRAVGGALEEEPESDEEAPTVLGLLERRGKVCAGDLRAALGVSMSTLGRLLAPLFAEGRVVREGAGAGARPRRGACQPGPVGGGARRV